MKGRPSQNSCICNSNGWLSSSSSTWALSSQGLWCTIEQAITHVQYAMRQSLIPVRTKAMHHSETWCRSDILLVWLTRTVTQVLNTLACNPRVERLQLCRCWAFRVSEAPGLTICMYVYLSLSLYIYIYTHIMTIIIMITIKLITIVITIWIMINSSRRLPGPAASSIRARCYY